MTSFSINQWPLLIIFLILLIVLINVYLIQISFLLPVVFIIIIFFIGLSIKQPKTAIMLLFFTKPIVDATWNYQFPLLGLNFLQISGILFPLMTVVIIYSYKINLNRYQFYYLINLLIISSCCSMIIYILNFIHLSSEYLINRIVMSLIILLQFINGFCAYYILPSILKTNRDRSVFIFILILASFFPLITGYLQILGIFEGRVLRTTGSLMRISGLYYDSTNLRFYSMQAIIAIFIYLKLNKSNLSVLSKAILLILVPMFLYIVYLGYSKSAIVILFSWSFTYLLISGNIKTSIIILSCLLLSYFFIPTINIEIDKLFFKEIMYYEGTLSEELEYTMLGGRIYRWEAYLARYISGDMIEQLFGYNFAIGIRSHNDFLRLLISNGFIGFLLYFMFLVFIGYKIFIAYFRYKDAISLGSVLLFLSFFIDSLGLTPSIYTNYSWFVFGIISLSINRDIIGKRKVEIIEAQSIMPNKLTIK